MQTGPDKRHPVKWKILKSDSKTTELARIILLKHSKLNLVSIPQCSAKETNKLTVNLSQPQTSRQTGTVRVQNAGSKKNMQIKIQSIVYLVLLTTQIKSWCHCLISLIITL